MYNLDSAISMIKAFESCALEAYEDLAGVLTIGWGHTGEVRRDDMITQEEADALLVSDVNKAANGVVSLLTIGVSINQFNALVDFAYNLGLGALKKSTLLKYLNGGETADEIADQFLRWDYAGGQEVPGLKRRREAERELFLKNS